MAPAGYAEQRSEVALLAGVQPGEQIPLAGKQVGKGGVDGGQPALGKDDQYAPLVLQVGLPADQSSAASRSIRFVMVPDVTRVAWSSPPGLS